MHAGTWGGRPERTERIWRGISVPPGSSQAFELRLYLCTGSDGLYAMLARYASIGTEALEAFRDMVAFDALIANTDRHGANYAFLRDNRTGHVTAIAPLYDHNLALFPRDMSGDYAAWRDGSRIYTDDLCRPSGRETTFDQQATVVLGARQREMIARVADIELRNVEGESAVPRERLDAWQSYLRVRTQRLLELPELADGESAKKRAGCSRAQSCFVASAYP